MLDQIILLIQIPLNANILIVIITLANSHVSISHILDEDINLRYDNDMTLLEDEGFSILASDAAVND